VRENVETTGRIKSETVGPMTLYRVERGEGGRGGVEIGVTLGVSLEKKQLKNRKEVKD